MKYTSFEQMSVWQAAMEIAVKIFNLTNGLPKSEDYGLTSQIRRSAVSISANVAEGFGRRTNADKAKFYIIARSSAFETKSHLIYGTRVGYFSQLETEPISSNIESIVYELNKLASQISQSHSQSQS